MTIRNVEVEGVSVVSLKPIDAVVESLKAAVGRPDMSEFARTSENARTFPELESSIQKGLGKTGLMLFMELDLGAILRKESGKGTPQIMRFIIGNPLIVKEMVKHVPDAGSYAPITILVDERPVCTCLMTAWLASWLRMKTLKPSLSPDISTRKSRASCEKQPLDGRRFIFFLTKERRYARMTRYSE